MNYKSIALSGPVAAGTTTAAKTLSKNLNLEYHSAGDFFRKYMKDHNIPLPNKEEIPDDVEKKIDKELTAALASQKPVVVDGLYNAYFARNMDHVLKVLLTANEETRIKRAYDRSPSHEESAADVKKRDAAHDAKFRKLYADEDFLDPKFFDLIIDTTNTTQEETAQQIIDKFKNG